MSYNVGQTITASSLNNLLGETLTAAPNAAVAAAKAGYLWGVGFGDRGYGQTAPVIGPVNAGNSVSNLTNLSQTLSNLASWQNTSTALNPPASALSSGAAVRAFPASSSPSIPDFLALLDVNRLNYQLPNMALTGNLASSTRASAWGSGTGIIHCNFTASFASENAARYFFNTGGEIRFALSHPNTSSAQNTAWFNTLNNSNFAFRANSSARISGSHGTSTGVGYYNLTTSWQNFINGSATFSAPYAANGFALDVRAVSIAGVNGARGSQIEFRVVLTDGYTGAFTDSVASGTNVIVSSLKANTGLSVIPANPTIVVNSGL